MDNWIIYLIDVLVVVTIFMGWALWQRHKYQKEYEGCVQAEYYTEIGKCYTEKLPLEENGIEVKAPKEHRCPRYYLNKASTFTVDYPEQPLLGLKFLQIQVQKVAWAENNPEPINPYEWRPMVTAELVAASRDEDFAAFAMAANKEIQALQRELAKALANSVNKGILYGMIAIAIITGIAGAAMAYQNFDLLNYIIERGGY